MARERIVEKIVIEVGSTYTLPDKAEVLRTTERDGKIEITYTRPLKKQLNED